MTLYEKIMRVYPDLTPFDFAEKIILQDDMDGKGEYIREWNDTTHPRPTQEQLEAGEV